MTDDAIAAARAAVLVAAGWEPVTRSGLGSTITRTNPKLQAALDAYRDALLDQGRAEGEARMYSRIVEEMAAEMGDEFMHGHGNVEPPGLLADARKRAGG